MSLRYALLGLLDDQPASGYDLTQRFDRGIGRFAWKAKHSQIYPELRKLEAEGLVEVVEEGPRGRRVYGITADGLTDLRGWLLSEVEGGKIRNEPLLRLFLMSSLSPEERLQVLRRVEQWSEESRTEVADIFQRLAEDDGPLPSGGYAAKFGVFMLDALHEWARWAIAEQEKTYDDA